MLLADSTTKCDILKIKRPIERFYRVLDNAESGCGLGLAIVREIAQQHHARVGLGFANLQQSKGTIVKVIFSEDSFSTLK